MRLFAIRDLLCHTYDRNPRTLQRRFNIRRTQPRRIVFDQQILARRCNYDALDSINRIRLRNLPHKGLIQRPLQSKMLLNFGHCGKADYTK